MPPAGLPRHLQRTNRFEPESKHVAFGPVYPVCRGMHCHETLSPGTPSPGLESGLPLPRFGIASCLLIKSLIGPPRPPYLPMLQLLVVPGLSCAAGVASGSSTVPGFLPQLRLPLLLVLHKLPAYALDHNSCIHDLFKSHVALAQERNVQLNFLLGAIGSRGQLVLRSSIKQGSGAKRGGLPIAKKKELPPGNAMRLASTC